MRILRKSFIIMQILLILAFLAITQNTDTDVIIGGQERIDDWSVPLPDYPDTTVSSQDSITVKPIFNIDGAAGRKKQLLVYGNLSIADDSTTWAATFMPKDLNPDSLYFFMAETDSANSQVYIEVRNAAGAVLFESGYLNAGTAEARKVFAFTSFAAIEEHAIVYKILVKNSGDAVRIGQVTFKRN